MSYDVYLVAELGGPGSPAVLRDLDWNYTSNCARIWRHAMPETDGLAGMHGMQAGVAAVILQRGIERMQTDPGTYEAMEPSNGWGTFYGQLGALEELLEAFRQHPRAKVEISR